MIIFALQAHSDSYWECFDLYGNDADVMLECKHKEQGLFKMRESSRVIVFICRLSCCLKGVWSWKIGSEN